jgi:chromosome segregation ATPase
MADFEIKITTPAELAGAQASLASLQGQIEATKLLGKSVDELVEKEQRLRQAIVQAQLNDITGKGGQAAKEMEEVGEAAKKGAEGVGELVGGHKGIHAIGHALNQAFPGMQQFTRFLTSGFTAAIGVALLAYAYLNEKVEEYSKLVDELGGSDNATGGWAKKLAENMRDSHVAADVLARDIQRILDAQESVAKATDELISRQKQQAEAEASIADAQKSLEEARVDLAERLGEITPEQAIRIRLEIDEEDFRRKQEAKIAGIKAELQARQHEQSSIGGRGGALDQDQQAVDRARTAADAAKDAKDRNDTLLENARKNLESAQEDQKKAEERLLQPHHFGDKADTFQRQLAEQAEETAQNKIGQYKKEIGQYEKKAPGLDTAAENAKKDLEEATTQWKEDAKSANELNKTIDNLTASLAGAQAESAALIRLHNQAAETRAATQNAPQEIARRNVLLRRAMEPDQGAGEVETERTNFNDLSQQAADAMNQANSAARHHGYGAPAVSDLVALVQKLTAFLAEHPALQPAARDDMQQEIDSLKQDISNLTSQINTNR